MSASVQLRRGLLRVYERARSKRALERLTELEQTQWLPGEKLEALTLRRIRALLSHAYQNVPHYRRTFDSLGFDPRGELKWDDFVALPTLNRVEVRALRSKLIARNPERGRLYLDSTSGSTGNPLQFAHDQRFSDYAAADHYRHYGWCGWELCGPIAFLWGMGHPKGLEAVKVNVYRWLHNALWGDAFTLRPETLDGFLDRMLEHRPQVLIGYASSLSALALRARDRGIQVPSLRGIQSSAEMLLPAYREIVESAFGCRIFDSYGNKEVRDIAHECAEHRGYHISVENCWLEVVDEHGRPCPPGMPGELTVTSLHNYGMPLIRYRTGDIGMLSASSCACGRGLPLLQEVQGRLADALITAKGEPVHGWYFNPLFWSVPNVRQYQIVQRRRGDVLIRIVLDRGTVLADEDRRQIVAGVQDRLGAQIPVELEFPASIPPGPSGKFRIVQCEVAA
ncbi:MAG: phenylacetate--CoA ligase family protein [Chloroflexi bacterium]|nr:phenylacetate--CoA ligase family protein [Chloroflexota bacterium]